MAEEGYKVTLNIYDLSQGLARQLSASFLGKAIEGIWHTGVVVYGNEYYFGGGIQHALAGTTQYGTPIRVFDLGVTHVPKEVFEEYLQEISSRYTAETYSLLSHNCNNFSNEVAQFLVGASIPQYILQLPNEVMSSPMGALIMPMIQQLETTMRAGAVPQAPQFKPPATLQTSQMKAAVQNASKSDSPVKSNSPTTDSGNAPEKAQEPGASSVSASNPSRNEGRTPNGGVPDPLGNARSKVQEEITREFATIMATGSLHASEAAALATRRVMERYGRLNMTM